MINKDEYIMKKIIPILLMMPFIISIVTILYISIRLAPQFWLFVGGVIVVVILFGTGMSMLQRWSVEKFDVGRELALWDDDDIKEQNGEDKKELSCEGCKQLYGRNCLLSVNHCIRKAEDYFKQRSK